MLLLPMFAPIYAKENKLPTNIQTHKVENEEAAIAAIETETRKESAIVWVEVAAVCIGGAYIIYKFRKNLMNKKDRSCTISVQLFNVFGIIEPWIQKHSLQFKKIYDL